MARKQCDAVERVLEKLYVEGEDLNTSEIGLMWRKPARLFRQAADERRKGCVYRCVDL